jgi:hypothetical protein
VVIFSPASPAALGEGALAWEGPESVLECVQSASAYEAAAELLAGPVEALVIDLRILRPCHVRLIEIAGQAGAKVLGVGSLPPWAANGRLGGLRLVGWGELAQVLGSIAGAPLEQRPAQGGTYETQQAAKPKAPSGPEPLLTAEELSALLGDVT